MIKKVLLALCVFIFSANITFAQNITVSGYGDSYDDAERDALRNAVEKAVGTLIDSQTLIRNNTLIEDEIYTTSRGFINNYTVVNKKYNSGNYEVYINADVDTNTNSRLMNELTRLGIIDKQLRDPKIAVIIPEYHIAARIPDPAGETAVIRKLTEAGFSRITDVSNIRYNFNKIYALSNNDLRSLADSLNVDILVVGETFSQGVGDVGKFIGNGRRDVGIVSCKARLEAKIFIVKTGQIIAANGVYGTAADLTEFIAAKKALNDAGEKMGDYIIDKLIGFGSSNNQSIEVFVQSSDFNKINKINSLIKNIQGVKSSLITDYVSGKATINVKYSGTPQVLFNKLSDIVDFNISMKSISYNTLSINAY